MEVEDLDPPVFNTVRGEHKMRRKGTILFFIALITLALITDKQYAFVYFTFWTMCVEFVGFVELVMYDKHRILGWITAPAWAVFLGFWIGIRPSFVMFGKPPTVTEDLFMLLPHGFNVLVLLFEPPQYAFRSVWVPMAYTATYVFFISAYHWMGGRNCRGNMVYPALNFDLWWTPLLLFLTIPLVGGIHWIGKHQQRLACLHSYSLVSNNEP